MDQQIKGDGLQPLLNLNIQLTEKEIYTCLKNTTQHISKKRLWIQSVILVIMFVYSAVGYFMDKMKSSMSLVIAIASIVILIAMWVVPLYYYNHEAKQMVQNKPIVNVKLFNDKLLLNNKTSVNFDDCEALHCGNLLVLQVRNETIGIPCRLTGKNDFKIILKKFGLS